MEKLYTDLIEKYKRYDAKQKKLLNEAYLDINKLSKEIINLKNKLSEYEDINKYKEYCKGHKFNDDVLWVTIQYPEYFNLKAFVRTKFI